MPEYLVPLFSGHHNYDEGAVQMVMFDNFKEFLVIVRSATWVRQGVFSKHMVAVEELVE